MQRTLLAICLLIFAGCTTPLLPEPEPEELPPLPPMKPPSELMQPCPEPLPIEEADAPVSPDDILRLALTDLAPKFDVCALRHSRLVEWLLKHG
jgi:hypothetical protein